jgi:hypothetical protein
MKIFKVIVNPHELTLRAESKGQAKRVFIQMHGDEKILEIINISDIIDKSITENADVSQALADM